MADREKVMQWLETCANGCEDGCPYEYKNLVYRVECKADLMSDALELLKAQEPVKPIKPRGSASWICGACKIAIGTSLIYRFCPWCGAEVKQDD